MDCDLLDRDSMYRVRIRIATDMYEDDPSLINMLGLRYSIGDFLVHSVYFLERFKERMVENKIIGKYLHEIDEYDARVGELDNLLFGALRIREEGPLYGRCVTIDDWNMPHEPMRRDANVVS